MTMHKIEVELTEEQIRLSARSQWTYPLNVACRKWVQENPELIPVTVWLTPHEVRVRAARGGAGYAKAGRKFDATCREVDL